MLGEEAHANDPTLLDRYNEAEHAFTVDPVDGTKNFVNGSPDHAVMIGEVRAGEVVRGWIWQPQHDAAYVAERGAGAFLNGAAPHHGRPGERRRAPRRRTAPPGGRGSAVSSPASGSWSSPGRAAASTTRT